MSLIEKELFSQIEKLVRNTSPEDFLRASKIKGISDHMKTVMECLALECLENTCMNINTFKSSKLTPKNTSTDDLNKNEMNLRSNRSTIKTTEDQIYELLINSKRFTKKHDMMNFMKLLGLRIDFNNKDSKIRTAKKIAKVFVSSPEQIKKDFLSMLNEKLDDQTKGWFDIIRSR
jgi:hypothetical protein